MRGGSTAYDGRHCPLCGSETEQHRLEDSREQHRCPAGHFSHTVNGTPSWVKDPTATEATEGSDE